MQRVLSLETSRCTDTSGEFVSKRLCVSFLFSIAFFALLGGYLLGRYATERALIIKKKTTLEDINVEDSKSFETLYRLSEITQQIHNSTKMLSTSQQNLKSEHIDEIYKHIQCNIDFVKIPDKIQFQNDVPLEISKIVHNQLKSFEDCYKTVSELLEQYVTPVENNR
ncbi:uncharacterized protein LOC108735426 [Agrilus planipennis]|uniref:Uncharacterized protein LOC108735426 n=1 Tax=Agrilus planipennis TaxID=224129 RepID=A0A1W4WG06_AGRPL|nr:uncharacterized protein LOC108735426 [Agrilus planipennis]